ncbi:MAG: hypothetical protein HY308_15865 [Gammaproteobacteria bacterium]|nr:hypothetical protein [Gammaproteobacteria bacterium]
MSATRYYSLRRLSPYQGTVQVAECTGFRAMSADGLRWRVQFLNQRTRLSSYGVWRADGHGSLIETERTQPIVRVLRERPPLPFPLADQLELWLLDAHEQLPLALLASTLSGRTPPTVTVARWRATLSGDDGFQAPSFIADAGPVSHISHGAVLDRCIQHAAGPQPQAQWFERAADGSAIGVSTSGLDTTLSGRRLERAWFPELLVREHWENEQERQLVRDYHEWHAANLLTHTNLSRLTRQMLEQAACRQSAKLFRVRHLLPEVVNEELLRIALVEAVIRQSA